MLVSATSRSLRALLILTATAVGLSDASVDAYYHVQRYSTLQPNPSAAGTFYANVSNSSSTLPPAGPALLTRPLCGRLSWQTPVKGMWYKDSAGHYAYELDACRLRRLSASSTQQCLSKTGRLAFLGDSVTRYQYLALAHFLTTGTYHQPYDDGQQSISNRGQWGGWGHYFAGATKLITQLAGPRGSLNCRCWKTHRRVEETWRFVLHGRDAAPAGPPVSMDCVYLYRWPTISRCGVAGLTTAFSLDPARPPQVVLFNMGIFWKGNNTRMLYHHMDTIFKAGAQLAANATRTPPVTLPSIVTTQATTGTAAAGVAAAAVPPVLAWKTTSHMHWDGINELLRPELHGWVTYDVRAVARQAEAQLLTLTWSWAAVHFLPVMYEQFNDLLLNILCDPTPGVDPLSETGGSTLREPM